MAKRSKDWNEDLASRLADLDFAREFLLALIDDGISLRDAIRKLVRTYGVSEYADLIGMSKSNLSRALNKNSNPTLSTLEQILGPLSLNISLARAA